LLEGYEMSKDRIKRTYVISNPSPSKFPSFHTVKTQEGSVTSAFEHSEHIEYVIIARINKPILYIVTLNCFISQMKRPCLN